jgi:hypothetical protein
MIFLIEYNRREGKIVSMESFQDAEHTKAEKLRLDRELELNRTKVDHEVILLQAASREALQQTHRRYFENLKEIARSTSS